MFSLVWRWLAVASVLSISACMAPMHSTMLNGHGASVAQQVPDRSTTAPQRQAVRPSKPVAYVGDDLWARLRSGFAMADLPNDDRVSYWIAQYSSRPSLIGQEAERARPYLHHIVQALEQRGMPTELALLPWVESAYLVKAVSSKKAAGLWQFMPKTGQSFGLAQNAWVDERYDVVKATNAAIDYLASLYRQQNNDWHLALAAYNWGPTAVSKARRQQQAVGLPDDYSALPMPKETRDYVPKLLALKQLVADPARYGVQLPSIVNSPYFVQVKKTVDIDIRKMAQLAQMSEADFRQLNPSHKKPMIVGAQQRSILLPADNAVIYQRNIKQYRGKLASWRPYQSRKGELLSHIAKRHGISLVSLKSINGLSARHKVAKGGVILVPNRGKQVGVHQVKAGDTLSGLARRYGSTVAAIRQHNQLGQRPLRIGQVLTIPK